MRTIIRRGGAVSGIVQRLGVLDVALLERIAHLLFFLFPRVSGVAAGLPDRRAVSSAAATACFCGNPDDTISEIFAEIVF